MSTVIETLAEYELYLKQERLIKDSTIRKINLSLSYFTELYGITDTKDLKSADIRLFYQWLKERQCKKRKNGVLTTFGSAHLQKIMTHIKAYVTWLSENAYLGTLVPADVRRGKVIEKIPAHLSKEEMSLLLKYLEKRVVIADQTGNKREIYKAYLRRAVIWMLYTTWLRNFELRSLTYDDIQISQLCGTVLGKGDRFGVYTFSAAAWEKLSEYLDVRQSMFPDTTFKYLFTLYEKGSATALTEQKLNIDIKDIAKAAGITQRMHAHLFRHTLAMHLIADGRTIVDVMQKLRHKNIATTSIYLSSNPETVQQKTKTLWSDLLYDAQPIVETEYLLNLQHSLILRMLIMYV